MFDTLTTLELNQYIGRLTEERTATHRKMVNPDCTPVISPLSDQWAVLSARYDELAEMVSAAYDELLRREQEARADPFGPDAYKSHRAGCVCPDCKEARAGA